MLYQALTTSCSSSTTDILNFISVAKKGKVIMRKFQLLLLEYN